MPEDQTPPAPLPELHTIVVGREAMACQFEIVFNAGEIPLATELAVEALDLVEELEGRITVYRDSSEIARLNHGAASAWQAVSPDLFDLLVRARELFDQTGGAFDAAAGSLVRVWGFLRRQGRTPGSQDLAAARAAAGMQWVELDHEASRVRFLRPGIELNLGAIGKGWALDQALGQLSAAGVPSALVHGGSSSVRAMGTQGPDLPGRGGWRVGMRHPLRPGRRLATVRLTNAALGTSGSGTQFFVEAGRRLGHILDPRTGLPAEGVLSATVVAPTAATADALSTALYVLGPAGLERIAPAGGPVSAFLVLPARRGGGVRLLTANAQPEQWDLEPAEGVEVTRAI